MPEGLPVEDTSVRGYRRLMTDLSVCVTHIAERSKVSHTAIYKVATAEMDAGKL